MFLEKGKGGGGRRCFLKEGGGGRRCSLKRGRGARRCGLDGGRRKCGFEGGRGEGRKGVPYKTEEQRKGFYTWINRGRERNSTMNQSISIPKHR